MAIGKVHSWKKVVAQIVLLGVPTAALLYYIIWKANSFYNILQNDWIMQGSYFAVGMLAAVIFYSYRFRFLTTTVLLGVIYWECISSSAITLWGNLMHFLHLLIFYCLPFYFRRVG